MQQSTPVTIHQARSNAAEQLRGAGIESPTLDARVLMAHVLDIDRTELLMRDSDAVAPADLERFQSLIDQRAAGVPVAYLTGSREFMGLLFSTTPAVLVPRPDTEPLVEWALDWLRQHPAANIVDIGTGSGAIAVSVTHHAPRNWTGTTLATDVSASALAVAVANAEGLLNPERRQRLFFRQGSLTDPLTEPVDLLLTNLPYLTPEQIQENGDLRHEPNLALDGGDDGLDLIRTVINDLHRVLAPGGAVGFELDPSQSADVQRLLKTALPESAVEVVYDLAGDERHVVAYSYPNPGDTRT